jgi:hypothetical protein
MASFNQSPLGQASVGLAITTYIVGVGTITPTEILSPDSVKSIILAEGKTQDSVLIPIDLRPKVGLLYPR